MPTPHEVTLTLPEFDTAVGIARLRIMASAMRGLNHGTTYDRSLLLRLNEEVVGVCGEMAVGKFVGAWFVPSVNTFHRVPDCLADVEVRATSREGGRLIVRDNDSSDRRYVLAIVLGDRVRLVGWMYGSEAKQEGFLADPHGHRPSWFVPQSVLHPMGDLDF